MTDRDPAERLTIGELAARTGRSAKALRLYDDLGLLRPAHVDPATGYRRYRPDQVATARLIGLLRGTDMGLAEIGLLLDDLVVDPALAVARLDEHLRRIEEGHAARRVLVRHIHATLRQEESTMFTVETRHVPAQRVLSMQRRVLADQTDGFVAEAKAAFAARLAGAAPRGPFTLIFHGIVSHESDGPVEAILGCPEDVGPDDVVGIRTEPAHDEAFTTITKAQWAYPAILAAYDVVAASPSATARPRNRLSCREVYLAEPDDVGDDDLLCDIAFPLGD